MPTRGSRDQGSERQSLRRLRDFEAGKCDVSEALEAMVEYEKIIGVKTSYIEQYRRTLECAPWRRCDCGLRSEYGIEIAIFRGSERNKRRGFHNLSVLAKKMKTLHNQRKSFLERTACG
jgi:hypothetical protein